MGTPDEGSGELFAPKTIELLKKLADLYTQAKSLILYSEEIDPTARSNIQVIKELRDANDHLMRVLAARLSEFPPNGSTEAGYCEKNLDKAIGHVYRAAFDSLDGTVMSLREKVVEVLANYPLAAIKDVIPNYWELRTKLDKLTQDVATHRAAKDVAGNVGETLNLYIQDTEHIKVFYTQIIQAGPALDDYLKCHKKEETQEDKRHFKVHTAAGLAYKTIAAIFVLLVGYWLGSKGLLSEPQKISSSDHALAISPSSSPLVIDIPQTSESAKVPKCHPRPCPKRKSEGSGVSHFQLIKVYSCLPDLKNNPQLS